MDGAVKAVVDDERVERRANVENFMAVIIVCGVMYNLMLTRIS